MRRNLRGSVVFSASEPFFTRGSLSPQHVSADGLRGPTPLLRIQSDERLVALTRRGNQAAYEALVGRYQARLLAFCRHMLGSREDAEDVLQEVFAAAFNAMIADERALNVRPWLYRIARNRSLNHLRRVQAIGVDSMDVHLSENGHLGGRQGPPPRGVPPAGGGRAGAARDAAHRAAAARDRRASATTRSPRRWTRPSPASSRCSCARGCRWPSPPRRASSPATRFATSSARWPRAFTA